MQASENIVTLIGRIGLCLLFVHGGWGKLFNPAGTQTMLAGHHLPLVPLAWVIAVVVELGGGLAILVGLFTRPVALVLAFWCVATALIGHSNLADRNMEIHFLKNLAMAGGFLFVMLHGAGAWSLDAWRARGRRVTA